MTQTIEIPDGYELRQISGTEYKLVKAQKLPDTWEEFCKNNEIGRNEAFIDINSCIEYAQPSDREIRLDRRLLPSKEKAEAILALCQLIQLRDCYNRGWIPNWNNYSQLKYIIIYHSDCLMIVQTRYSERLLAFKSNDLCEKFLGNFRYLIEKLAPLYR